MKKSLGVLVLFFIPSLALAAGFAKQSLFLSKSPVTEGDAVRIYAVLSNETSTAFNGTVVFSDNSQKIGDAPASIPAGGTQTVSVAWKPTAGTHPVTAKLETGSGAVVESESASFDIASKPKPATITTGSSSIAAVESSLQIQNQIGSFSPAAKSATEPFFNVVDSLRSTAADFIDTQLASTKAKLASTPKTGIVAGESVTQDTIISNPWGMTMTVFFTLYIYLLTVLRFIISNAGVFYPVLAIAFLYSLWKMYRHFRRPAY
jgi:hypothetical protein